MTDYEERLKKRRQRLLFTLFGRMGVGTATFGLFLLFTAGMMKTDTHLFLLHAVFFVLFGAAYTILFAVQRSLMGRVGVMFGIVWATVHLFEWPSALWVMAPMTIAALVVAIGLPYPKKILPPAPKKEEA